MTTTSRFLRFALLLFILPFAGFVWHLQAQDLKAIRYTEKERTGIHYQRALYALEVALQQYRGQRHIADHLAQPNAPAANIQAVRSAIEQMTGVFETYPLFKSSLWDDWQRLRSSIEEALEANTPRTPEENFEYHTQLINQIITFMFNVGNISGLVLDPQSGSYHLAVLLSENLPVGVESIAYARGFASGYLAQGTIPTKAQEALLVNFGRQQAFVDMFFYVSMLATDNARLKQWQELQKNTSPLTCLQDYEASIRNAFEAKNPINPQTLFDEGTRCIAQFNTLYEAGWALLDEHLAERLQKQWEQWWEGLLISLAIFAAMALALMLAARNSIRKEVVEHAENARLQAEESSRLKSEFLANMSHEIRTPMNGIIGMLQLLQETPLNADQKHYAQTLLHSADALLSLVNDILDFSKIEAGQLSLEKKPFDLCALAQHVTELMTRKAHEKNLTISLHIADEVPGYVTGDALRLQQVLNNLMSNAIKFTEQGFVRLTLETAPNGEILFCVEDSGMGIPEDKHDYIFNKFTQADSSSSRKFGGTGLGLAICKQIVGLMHGQMGVESTLDKGSRFWFSVPFTPTETAADAPHTPALMSPSSSPKNFDGKRILLVEDNPVNQMVASLLLKKHQLHITTANHGGEALETLSKEHFDLVLMDCQMPEMDGFEATCRIRALEKTSGTRIPIVALTANALQGDDTRCFEAGMDDYLTKPLRDEALVAMLEKWLG